MQFSVNCIIFKIFQIITQRSDGSEEVSADFLGVRPDNTIEWLIELARKGLQASGKIETTKYSRIRRSARGTAASQDSRPGLISPVTGFVGSRRTERSILHTRPASDSQNAGRRPRHPRVLSECGIPHRGAAPGRRNGRRGISRRAHSPRRDLRSHLARARRVARDSRRLHVCGPPDR